LNGSLWHCAAKLFYGCNLISYHNKLAHFKYHNFSFFIKSQTQIELQPTSVKNLVTSMGLRGTGNIKKWQDSFQYELFGVERGKSKLIVTKY
jgi:hypothetical protein